MTNPEILLPRKNPVAALRQEAAHWAGLNNGLRKNQIQPADWRSFHVPRVLMPREREFTIPPDDTAASDILRYMGINVEPNYLGIVPETLATYATTRDCLVLAAGNAQQRALPTFQNTQEWRDILTTFPQLATVSFEDGNIFLGVLRAVPNINYICLDEEVFKNTIRTIVNPIADKIDHNLRNIMNTDEIYGAQIKAGVGNLALLTYKDMYMAACTKLSIKP